MAEQVSSYEGGEQKLIGLFRDSDRVRLTNEEINDLGMIRVDGVRSLDLFKVHLLQELRCKSVAINEIRGAVSPYHFHFDRNTYHGDVQQLRGIWQQYLEPGEKPHPSVTAKTADVWAAMREEVPQLIQDLRYVSSAEALRNCTIKMLRDLAGSVVPQEDCITFAERAYFTFAEAVSQNATLDEVKAYLERLHPKIPELGYDQRAQYGLTLFSTRVDISHRMRPTLETVIGPPCPTISVVF